MYEWWTTPIESEGLEDGTAGENSGRELAGEIDEFRRQLLVGIVNQHLGHLPSSLGAAQYSYLKDASKSAIMPGEPNYDGNDWAQGNSWLDFLAVLRIFIPDQCSYEYLMTRTYKELNILVNGEETLGSSGNILGEVPIDDPDLLDLLADFFGGLDGIFGLILATNPNISSDLTSELLKSDYYLTSSNTSTKKLLENRE